jgi:hypothetical protein
MDTQATIYQLQCFRNKLYRLFMARRDTLLDSAAAKFHLQASLYSNFCFTMLHIALSCTLPFERRRIL